MLESMDILWSYIYEFWDKLFSLILDKWNTPETYTSNIIDGELIRINLSWVDFPLVLSGLTIVILIYLFVKFFVKLLGVFVWK